MRRLLDSLMVRVAVACVALLWHAAGHAGAMTGELALAARLERKLTQDHLARQAAYVLAATATQDADGYPLPPPQGAGAGPAGGGLVPSTSAAPKADGFGASLGYCAWDNGTITSHTGYIAGTANIAAVTLAVVTPGADNIFQTACAGVASGAGASGDDYVVAYTAGQIFAGVQGSSYFADPVVSAADLALLNASALKDGQVRLVRSTNALHRYDAASATWVDLAGPWARSANDLSYTAGKVGVGTASPGRALSVHSATDVPLGLSSGGTRAGIDILATGGSVANAFVGYDTTGSGQLRLEAKQAGASLALATTGGSATLSSAGVLTAGSVVASSLLSSGPITTSALQSTGSLAITATAVTVSGATTFASPVVANAGISAAGATVAGTMTADAVAAGAVTVNGNAVWHAGNLSLANYLARTDLLGGGGLLTNTAVSSGGSALAVNTTGNNNLAVGYQALFLNTTGSDNTAVGASALRANTTGFGNVAVGANALGVNTGTGNTALGRAALLANTTGGGNVAVGSGAGSKVTSGGFNVLVGGTSGSGLTTGVHNIFIGYSSGQGVVTGNSNVFIGQQAGFQAPAAMTGTVVLGRYDAPTADNTIYLADGSGALRAQFDASLGMAVKGAISSAAAGTSLVLENSGTGTGTAARQVFKAGGTDRVYLVGGQGTAAGDGLLSVAVRDGTAGTMLERLRVDLAGITTTGALSAGSMTVNGNAVWHAGNLTPSDYISKSSLTGAGAIATNTTLSSQSDALAANTTGTKQSAFGVGALTASTTGSLNSAFGYKSLAQNTTGSSNSAVGAGALTSNKTGSRNTAVGTDALASHTSGDFNTAIGDGALYSDETGVSNVAAGRNALYSNTTGIYNVAVGVDALLSNSTGGLNTAIGYRASASGTTGSGNVSVGNEALYSNTTGSFGVAIGYSALYSNTSGQHNVAIGAMALTANITGSYSVAVGRGALQANTTGANNAALGYQALTGNTTGASNSAFGWGALRSNTTAANNAAFGYAALQTTTTGHSNTAVGTNALTMLTTASGNVAAGNTAGFSVSTGSNNVFIGSAAGSSVTAGGDNVYVGNQAGVGATVGVFNTALGSNSLMNATSSLNTAVGFGALRAVTSGANNIGLGTNTGSAVTTGAANLLLGHLAGSGSGTPVGLTGTVVIGGYQTPTANQTIYLADGQGTLRAQLDAASGLQVKGTLWPGSPTTTLVLENGGVTAGTAARQLFLAAGAQQAAVDGGLLNAAGDGFLSVSVRDSTTSALVQRWRATASGGNLYGTWIATSGLEVTSDERLKKDIVALSGEEVLKKLQLLRPVEYRLIRDNSHQYGFLAQEVRPVFPHLVSESPDTGYLALRYTEVVPLLTAAIQELAEHKLDNVVGRWARSSDKKERLLFEPSGTTVLRGHGDIALAIRNAEDGTVASVSRDGDLTLAGIMQFTGARRGGLAFNPTGTLVSSDSPGEIVVSSKAVPRAALRLQYAGTSDADARVYGYVFGDALGVGLADGAGNKLLSANASNGRPAVTVHGSLTVGDGASSEIVLSAGTALRTFGDGALQIEAAQGVRVVNPTTKETVIDLGSDGSLKARRFLPTEVVSPYAACSGMDGSIARDARGQVVVCAN